MIPVEEERRILALLRGSGRDSKRGLEELYELTRKSIFGLALRMTGSPALADDAVQETFVDVLRGIGGFRGEARLTTWLYRVTLMASTRVSNRARPRATEALSDELADTATGPSTSAADRDAATRILTAIAALPAPQRAVLALHAIDGVPQTEIAMTLGIPEGTVHSRLHAARSALRDRLGFGDRWGATP